MATTAASKKKEAMLRKLFRGALLELMSSKPIGSISIRELCETAGISRTAFTHYYGGFHQLINEIELKILSETIPSEKISSETELQNFLEKAISYIKENQTVFLLLHRNDLLLPLYKKVLLAKFAEFDSSPSGSMRAIWITEGSLAVVVHWLENMEQYTEEEMINFLYNSITSFFNSFPTESTASSL